MDPSNTAVSGYLLTVVRPGVNSVSILGIKRLRWSRGSVLAFSTQVRGFKPGRSRRIFKGEKILCTPSFGGEVKPSVPCRRFAACKRSLNVAWKSTFKQNYRTVLAHRVPSFATRGLSRCVVVRGHLVAEAGTSKLGGTQGCTISL